MISSTKNIYQHIEKHKQFAQSTIAIEIGLIGLAQADQLMQKLIQWRLDEKIQDTLLLLSHPPSLAIGARDLDQADLLLPLPYFEQQGIHLHQHVHEMMAGSILWVSWHQITELFIVFAIIGVFHYIFREKFLALTDHYNNHHKHSLLWDFLFNASFCITVVHSVKVCVILTIFAFLIIPASISALFSQGWRSRILIGWGLGTLVTVCGLYLSWTMDVPSSPTVILFLGVFLLLALVVKSFGVVKTGTE